MPGSRIVAALENLSRWTGRAVAWLTLAMVLVTFLVVLLRYVFDFGLIWMQESITWMHAMVFMIGAAYTLEQGQHVRVDIFYREMSPRRQAVVDIAGVLLLLLPLCVFFAWQSWDYVAVSWRIAEGSREAGGLPYPFTPLMKSFLIAMPVLLALQGLALLAHSVARLRGADSESETAADTDDILA